MPYYRPSPARPAALLAAAAFAAILTGCQTLAPMAPAGLLSPHQNAVEGPHIRPIDRACLPVGTSPPGEIPLFRQDVLVRRAEIATIDSFASNLEDPATVKAQLEDLQCKARLTGADALIRVRKLNHDLYGFVNNPNTPFPSVMQGASERSFFRATAIKYQEPVAGDPARVDVPEPPLPPGTDTGPRRTNRSGRLVPVPFSSPTGAVPPIGGGGSQPAPAPPANSSSTPTNPLR